MRTLLVVCMALGLLLTIGWMVDRVVRFFGSRLRELTGRTSSHRIDGLGSRLEVTDE